MKHSTAHSRRTNTLVVKPPPNDDDHAVDLSKYVDQLKSMRAQLSRMRKLRNECGKYYFIECWEADDGWRTQIRHLNGNLLYASEEDYSSKSACLDTAGRMAKMTGMKLVVLKPDGARRS